MNELKSVGNADCWQLFVLDCLHLCLRKEGEACSRRSLFTAMSRRSAGETTLPLEDYFGIDLQFELDREKYVMSIICRRQVFTLAFHNQTMMESWRDFISHHLGEGSEADFLFIMQGFCADVEFKADL